MRNIKIKNWCTKTKQMQTKVLQFSDEYNCSIDLNKQDIDNLIHALKPHSSNPSYYDGNDAGTFNFNN